MVEITPSAHHQIAEYFKNKEVQPIRIFLNEGGWGGPSLAMALDEPRDTDNVFNVNGFQFVVDKEFYEKAKPISVDFMGYGFRINSSINFSPSGSCGGCHGSCSTDQK